MTDADSEAGRGEGLDPYDQIAEWCAVLESIAEGDEHPYRVKKLREIAEHLRRLRESDPGGDRDTYAEIGASLVLAYEDGRRLQDVVVREDVLRKIKALADLAAPTDESHGMIGPGDRINCTSCGGRRFWGSACANCGWVTDDEERWAAPTDEAPEGEDRVVQHGQHGRGGPYTRFEKVDEETRRAVAEAVGPPVEEGERGEDFTRRMLRQVLEASQKHEPITLGTAHEEALQDAIDRLRPPNARQGEGDEPTNDEARRYVERGEEHWSPDRTALLLDWWAGNVEEKREETGDDGYGVIIQPEMARWIADRLRSTPQGEEKSPDYVARRRELDEGIGPMVHLYRPGQGAYQRWLHDTEGGRDEFAPVWVGDSRRAPQGESDEPTD